MIKETNAIAPHDARAIWPDILRIFAVAAVVILHTAGVGFLVFEARSTNWQICNIYGGLARFGVPCFVMLSGMFILDPAKEYPLKKLFLQKILRIAAAFFFWSAFYSLFAVIECRAAGKEALIIFFRGLFAGYYHMWFLGMISGLYIITPFLRHIAKDEKLLKYFLLLSFIFVYCGNVLRLLPKTAVGEWITMITGFLEMNFVAGYCGYFLWGYWLAKHELSAKIRKIIYFLGIIGIIITVGGNGAIGYWRNEVGSWTFDNLLPNVMLTATAIFVFCKYNFNAEQFSAGWRKIIGRLGKWSFGIYLVHVFFLEHLYRIGLPHFFCHPALSVLISSAVVFLASFIVVLALSRIPVLKKYVI